MRALSASTLDFSPTEACTSGVTGLLFRIPFTGVFLLSESDRADYTDYDSREDQAIRELRDREEGAGGAHHRDVDSRVGG